MKKLICAMLLVVSLAAVLVSCGSFVCTECGKEKSGDRYEADYGLEEMEICEECCEKLGLVAD